METTIFCSFDQRLTAHDVTKLARLVGAVVPVPDRAHLISSSTVGLGPILEDRKTKDYATIRTRVRNLTLTILRKVEGNQMVLGVPVHGHVYTIKNTGPVPWEKGDTLTPLAPIFSPDGRAPALVTVGDWKLVLPWIVPRDLAIEINQRLLLQALLALDRSREEVRAVLAQLRVVRFRDITLQLPEPTLGDTALVDLRNVCVYLSMIANLSNDVTMAYVRKLALEDNSMLLVKCQEILGRRGLGHHGRGPGTGPDGRGGLGPCGARDDPFDQPPRGIGRPEDARPATGAGAGDGDGNRHDPRLLTPAEELNKLTALFCMIRQTFAVISEEVAFVVCDLSPDDQSAVCLYKG